MNDPAILSLEFCVFKTPSAASFIEDILLPDTGSTRRQVEWAALLPAFRGWANINMAPVIQYDHGMFFTGYEKKVWWRCAHYIVLRAFLETQEKPRV